MVVTSIIFLLLSNSITLRRDKSILYSRATISTITCVIAFFIFITEEWLSLANILALILFNI